MLPRVLVLSSKSGIDGGAKQKEMCECLTKQVKFLSMLISVAEYTVVFLSAFQFGCLNYIIVQSAGMAQLGCIVSVVAIL